MLYPSSTLPGTRRAPARLFFAALLVAASCLALVPSAHAANRLSPPTQLHVTGVTPTSISVRWAAPQGASAFRVKYSSHWSFAHAHYRFVRGTAVKLTGLTASRRYYVRVRAVAPVSRVGLSDYTARHGLSVVTAAHPRSSGAAVSRGSMVVGETKPTGSNVGTGVVAPAPTQVATSADGRWSNGVLTITKDLKNKVVNGFVKIGANGVTVENCDIRGDARHAPTGSKNMVDTGGGYSGTVVRYNNIHSTFRSRFINAIGPRNVVAEYNDISHVTDGFVPPPVVTTTSTCSSAATTSTTSSSSATTRATARRR